MSKRTMGGAAAAAVIALLVTTGGALAPSPAAMEQAPRAASSVPSPKAVPVSQEVFWERICRMLRLCG
ncbi:hypothetical protein OVA14_06980 [Agrococcus sp. SL85]|uniref:hypothetical protein n=1 Tax=Agrococcus sp. SL85 TaxID=2995141 RepID=UPI00226C6BF5|nr:hypothetical protein [Agrococcus sp. SL85]WAC65139.1 hypothetical protein OVA14_06980 [Agrococcus sp. SL85]